MTPPSPTHVQGPSPWDYRRWMMTSGPDATAPGGGQGRHVGRGQGAGLTARAHAQSARTLSLGLQRRVLRGVRVCLPGRGGGTPFPAEGRIGKGAEDAEGTAGGMRGQVTGAVGQEGPPLPLPLPPPPPHPPPHPHPSALSLVTLTCHSRFLHQLRLKRSCSSPESGGALALASPLASPCPWPHFCAVVGRGPHTCLPAPLQKWPGSPCSLAGAPPDPVGISFLGALAGAGWPRSLHHPSLPLTPHRSQPA